MNTILLGNLIKIRWIAITGQLLAIFLFHIFYLLKYQFLNLFHNFIIGAVNFYSYFEERKIKTISNIKAFLFLLFDTYN